MWKWLKSLFVIYDHKRQELTEELLNEYKEQQRLDEESCFDQCK